MASSRYLCSHLVRLTAEAREQWVNLEEIWETGAVLECEASVRPGVFASISAGEMTFAGRVAAVEQHEFGWCVELAFSPLTPWSIESWKPQHAVDPAKL